MEDCREPGGLCNERSPQDIQDGTSVLRQSPLRGGTGKHHPAGKEKKKLPSTGTPVLTAYQRALSEAAKALAGMRFGRCVHDGAHDDRYWKAVEGDNPMWGRALELRPGTIDPGEAIEKIFAERARWSFECAEFVQVSHLAAHVKILGREGFKRRVQGTAFRLRPQWSTGLKGRAFYFRETPGGPIQALLAGVGKKRSPIQDMDRLVREAPIGSRVGWIRQFPEFPQNTIKLGPDRFAAHHKGWKDGDRVLGLFFTRSELEKVLRDGASGRVYVPSDNVLISHVELYDTP